MMKVFILIMALMLELSAVSQNEVVGKWYAVSQTTNNGTLTIEKEYLHLNADRTFSIVVLVSLQKEEAFIKDLRIEGSGIWKAWNNTLVAVVNKVKVPSAKEVYLISQESLRNLSENFKRKFQNEPIRISTIHHIDKNSLITVNEKAKKTSYKRQ
jgi:hypothetical protein